MARIAQRAVLDQVRELLGGWPRTRSQYEREAERFGCAVSWHARLPDESSCLLEGIIHVPDLDVGESPRRCHIHELVEAALLSDAHAPVRADPAVSRHDIARAIDLSEPPRCRSAQRDRLACRLAGRLGAVAFASGCDTVTMRRRQGRWMLQLGSAPEMPA